MARSRRFAQFLMYLWLLTLNLYRAVAAETTIAAADADGKFIEWFTQNGGRLSGINIARFGSEGRGVLAVNDIEKDSEIITVPSRIIFSADSLSVSEDAVHRSIARLFSSDEDIIRASLLVEKARGVSSSFAPYIAVLPAYVPSLIHFTESELSELQNSALKADSLKNLAKEQNDFKFFKEKLASVLPREVSDFISFDEFKWATAIVDSRGLRFKGKVNLAPFADMFNYAPSPEPRAGEDGQFFLRHHKLETDGSITITADHNQAAGAQLYEDYGDNSDNIYLQHHGFIPDFNPFRCVPVVAPGSKDEYGFSASRTRLLKALQFERGPPVGCIKSSGWLHRAIEVYLTTLAFTEQEVESCLEVVTPLLDGKGAVQSTAWSSLFRDCMYDDVQRSIADTRTRGLAAVNKDGRALSAAEVALIAGDTEHVRGLTARTLDRVTSWLHSTLASYPTSIEQDEETLKQLSQKLATTTAATDDTQKNKKESDKQKNDKQNVTSRGDLHLFLAVLYRLALKQQLSSIGKIYGVDLSTEKVSSARSLLASSTAFSTLAERRSSSSAGNSGGSKQQNTVDAGSTESSSFDFAENNSTEYADIEAERMTALTLENKIELFNQWYTAATPTSAGPSLKIAAAVIPGYRIGVVATEEIKAEEIYLSVPVDLIIDTNKAASDDNFGRLIDTLLKIYKRRDEYHEMLLFLIYERVVKHEKSKYWPYLRLLHTPSETTAAVPTSWTTDLIDSRIRPSASAAAISMQFNRTERTYTAISSVGAIQAFFPKGLLTYELYRWASSVLDSRTIWWDGKMHLVPMLDFINCKEGPDPTRVHATRLDVSGTLAVTKAGWDFKVGEQVFENYGQSNYIYFMHHGFSLPPGENTHDCVLFPLNLNDAETRGLLSKDSSSLMQDVWKKISNTRGTVCLSWPISEEMWLYLAVKLNQVKVLKKRGLLGKPSKSAAELLIKTIEASLAEYARHESLKKELVDVLEDDDEEEEGQEVVAKSTPHAPTLGFLRSEIHTLRTIRSLLETLVKSSPPASSSSSGGSRMVSDLNVDEVEVNADGAIH